MAESIDDIRTKNMVAAYQHAMSLGNPQDVEWYVVREACRKHFYYFVKQAWPHIPGEDGPIIDGWHVAALAYHFQALAEGQMRNLIINIPGGCSKSTIGSVLFPAWVWTNKPSAGLWMASFSHELCERDADRTRDLINSDWYRHYFGDVLHIREDQNQRMKYNTNHGGWRLSASIESRRGFGNHPSFLLIDDPHNPQEALSQTMRKMAHDFWSKVVSTRGIVKGVGRAIYAQRLHEDDLSGYVMSVLKNYTLLRIPMEYDPELHCETNIRFADIDDLDEFGKPRVKNGWKDPRTKPGELMWPAGMDADKVEEIKAGLTSAHQISGQLQQCPTSPEGDMFQKDWFGSLVDAPPKEGHAVRAWDKASTTGRRADYTAGVCMVYDGKYLYVEDVQRFKAERRQRDERIRKTAERDAELFSSYEIRFEMEPGSSGKDAAQVQCEELGMDFRVKVDKAPGKPGATDDSAKGWEVWCDVLSRGLVKLVKGPWNQVFVDEHLSAPLGRNDDMIDAAAHAAMVLMGSRNRGRIRRPLLLVTPEEKLTLAEDQGKRLCDYCVGLGCETCGWSGFTAPRGDVESLLAARFAEEDESESLLLR